MWMIPGGLVEPCRDVVNSRIAANRVAHTNPVSTVSHTARISLAAARGEHSAPGTLLRVQHGLRARAVPAAPRLVAVVGPRCDSAEGTTDRDRGQAA